jgi:NTP pyrophosphatase (non-canonical NTP hydrolase)
MNKQQHATEFINALARQVKEKSLFKDGIENDQDPLILIASIAEELGEVSTDYVRGRIHGAIAECVDVAHSALLLALELDKDGEVLKRIRP